MIEIVECKCTMVSDPVLAVALRKAATWLDTQSKISDIFDITFSRPDDYNDWIVNLYW